MKMLTIIWQFDPSYLRRLSPNFVIAYPQNPEFLMGFLPFRCNDKTGENKPKE